MGRAGPVGTPVRLFVPVSAAFWFTWNRQIGVLEPVSVSRA